MTLCILLFAGIPTVLWVQGQLPMLAFVGISLVTAIILRLLWGEMYAASRDSNWVFAYGPGGIWLNLRSYRNYSFEPALTVAHLSFDELACVQQESMRRSEDTGDGTMVWQEHSLCLQLHHDRTEPLEQAIDSERVRKSTQKVLGGMTVQSRSNHVPVRMDSDGRIRVMWRSRFDSIRPGVNHVFAGLAKYVRIQPELVEGDEPDWEAMSDQQFDDHILELVASGETFRAVKLLKARKAYSTTQAKTFVDELTSEVGV